jgi:hypothetical protein
MMQNPKHPEQNFELTAYEVSNLAVKTVAISFSVSLFGQPLQTFLNQSQMKPTLTPKSFAFRSIYTGFSSYALAGQKRGAVAVYAKHSEKNHEEKCDTETGIYHSPWFFTGMFSQIDILLSNGLKTKSKLENVKIITPENFKWSCGNWYKLTFGNWGSRSFSGLVNYAALGIIGNKCCSFFNFEEEYLNKFLGGVSAGVLSTFFTGIPDHFSDRKILQTTLKDGQLCFVSSLTMFKGLKTEVQTHGLLASLSSFFKQHYLKEILIRCPQTALTFGIIFTGDHLLGTEPLRMFTKAIKP